MDNALKWFTRLWLILLLVLNILGVVGMLIGAPTLSSGWRTVEEMYSPLNVANFIVEVILLSPVIGAEYWRRKRHAARRIQGQRTE